MQTNVSLQMNKIKKYKKRRYLNDNGVKIVLLVVSFPDLGNRNASDAPIISIDFIDNDNSSLLFLPSTSCSRLVAPSIRACFCSGVTLPSRVILIFT